MLINLAEVYHARRDRYATVVAASLVCLVSLYPSPSPLLHLLFLPLLILLEKHHQKLCALLGSTLYAILVAVSISSGRLQSFPTAFSESGGAVVLAISTIACHRRCLARVNGVRVWNRAGSFGLLWATVWAIWRRSSQLGRSVSFSFRADRGDTELTARSH